MLENYEIISTSQPLEAKIYHVPKKKKEKKPNI